MIDNKIFKTQLEVRKPFDQGDFIQATLDIKAEIDIFGLVMEYSKAESVQGASFVYNIKTKDKAGVGKITVENDSLQGPRLMFSDLEGNYSIEPVRDKTKIRASVAGTLNNWQRNPQNKS